MNKKTYAKYTEMTVEDFGEYKIKDFPLEGFEGKLYEDTAWEPIELYGISLMMNDKYPFMARPDACFSVRKVKEIDPRVTPEGVADLPEPFLAFVGEGPLKGVDTSKYTYRGNPAIWAYIGVESSWSDLDSGCSGAFDDQLYAIDVRYPWSQEHYPEICACYDLEELCGKPKRKRKYETFMDYIEANQDQVNLITAKDAFSAAREEI